MNDKIYHIGLDARFYRSETGGLGRYTRELIDHLAKLDTTNRYTVLLTKADLPEWTLKQANFTPEVVDIPHYSLAEQTTLTRVLNQHHFDLVHFLNFNHPIFYRRPFVTTLHDLTLYFFPAGRSKKSQARQAAFRLIFRHALTAAQKVIAISQYTAKDATKHLQIPKSKMEVIYEGGPDPQKLPKDHQTEVKEYLKTDAPYFLFVSQWRPHKGILTLIEAFNAFKSLAKSDHKLVLLGNQKVAGDEVLETLNSSPYKDDIIAPGFAPDHLLPALYHHATAFVVPSEYEGFGLPVLEAFTYKTPVIVANNSSLPEVTGNGGLYFKTRDAKGLAERMEHLVRDKVLVDDLIKNSQEQLAKFSWEKTARETLLVYKEILDGNSKHQIPNSK